MTGTARVGELLDPVAIHIAEASIALARRTTAEPELAATAFRDLAHHLRRLTFEALGGTEAAVAGVRHTTPDDAGVRLYDALRTVALRRRYDIDRPVDGAGAAWAAAADRVGAAVDVLTTQRTSDGAWRGPDAHLIDNPALRSAALIRVASMVAGLGAPLPLLRHRYETGAWSGLDLIISQAPDLLQAAADIVQKRRASSEVADQLLEVTVARPSVRVGDADHELADRLARIRHHSWALSFATRPPVGTLTDIAVLGVAVNQHAADLGRSELTHQANRWRTVHAQLVDLRTATPPSAAFRADISAIRRLLNSDTIGTGVGTMAEIGAWSFQTFDHLARTSQLHAKLDVFTRDEISEDPDLASSKLSVVAAPANARMLEASLLAYRQLTGVRSATIRTPGGPIASMQLFFGVD